ncbi:MAG: hypothetical protein ACRC50_14315 [Gaiella sp.]
MGALERMIGHHFSGTSLAIELVILGVVLAGGCWLVLRERRRRRSRAADPTRPTAPMRDPER